MTADEFATRYEILTKVSDGPIRTFHAVSSKGPVVMVHFVDGDEAEQSRVLEGLDRLPSQEKARVLTVENVEGKPVVVTKFIMDFTSLDAWIDAHTGLLGTPDSTAPGTRTSPPARGEFARLFHDAADPIEGRDPAAAPGRPPSTPPESGSQEFERLFASGTGSGEPDQPPPPHDSPADRAPAAAPEPPTPEAPPASPAPPAAEPDSGPGEFTRMFGAAQPPSTPEEEAPEAPPPAPPEEEEEKKEPGEFTRMFQARSAPPEPPPASATPEGGHPPEAPPTGADAPAPLPPPLSPPEAAPPAPAPPRPEAPPPPPPEAKKGPGEFTRMFRARSAPPAPPAPPGPPEPTYGEPEPSRPAEPTGGPQLRYGPTGLGRAEPTREGGLDDSYLSRLHGSGPASSEGAVPPTPQGPVSGPRPPSAPPPSGPSDYTRVIKGIASYPQTPKAPGPPPGPPGPRPDEKTKGRGRIYLVLLGIVIIATLGLVLLFALTGRGGSNGTPGSAPDSVPSAVSPAQAGGG